MPSYVSADESSTPNDANITVKDLVSDPNSSAPIYKYGMIAAGTQPRSCTEILLYVSFEIFDLIYKASALVLTPSPISFSIW